MRRGAGEPRGGLPGVAPGALWDRLRLLLAAVRRRDGLGPDAGARGALRPRSGTAGLHRAECSELQLLESSPAQTLWITVESSPRFMACSKNPL